MPSQGGCKPELAQTYELWYSSEGALGLWSPLAACISAASLSECCIGQRQLSQDIGIGPDDISGRCPASVCHHTPIHLPNANKSSSLALPACRLSPSYGSRQPLPHCDVAVADGLNLPYRSGKCASLWICHCQTGGRNQPASLKIGQHQLRQLWWQRLLR